MHLVVDQVVQLQVVHVANGGRTLEALAGTAVIQVSLGARIGQALGLGDIVRIGQLQHVLDFFFRSTVEHG
ncbi:hypothetical protein SDC9_118962 [bioreactor metagenome]|uniref:Uncharacterized protein n=1 Tax=bioreactor metagenome TaxID=1076179 RepID=A0A645C2I9_9ZZZZ